LAKPGTVIPNKAGFKDFIQSRVVSNILREKAAPVIRIANATAPGAELGSSRLAGYAAAGFRGSIQKRSKRQRILIKSNAGLYLSLRVHFATQQRFGIGHMRLVMLEARKAGLVD